MAMFLGINNHFNLFFYFLLLGSEYFVTISCKLSRVIYVKIYMEFFLMIDVLVFKLNPLESLIFYSDPRLLSIAGFPYFMTEFNCLFQATGVRAIAFHPDGRTLFCGLEDSLKV